MTRFLGSEASEAFERALALRLAVFVVEQGVPEDEELDGADEAAWHWLVEDARTGETLATARMLPYQEGCQSRPVAKIGRVAVAADQRGKRLGERLMRDILAFAQAEGFEQAILDAQTPAMPFYERLGFVPEGSEFLDGGIPHYRMRCLLP